MWGLEGFLGYYSKINAKKCIFIFFLVFVKITSIIKNMKTLNITLGPLEVQFLGWAQMENKDQVKTGDFVKAVGISPKQEADLFYNLSSSGVILKLWRGMYLVPLKVPLGGRWTPSPYLIMSKYMRNLDAKFQISGNAIFNLYGYSDQLSSWFTIYNNKISKKVSIPPYRFNFVKVVENRLGKVVKKIPPGEKESEPALISSKEQALLDIFYDYKKYGTLPKAYKQMKFAIISKKIDPDELAKLAIRYGNTMSQKRIGWALDKLKVGRKTLLRLNKKISKKNFLVPLDPKNNIGSIDKRWGVIENVKLSS